MLWTRFTVVFCCEAYLAFSFIDAVTAVFALEKKNIFSVVYSYWSYSKKWFKVLDHFVRTSRLRLQAWLTELLDI